MFIHTIPVGVYQCNCVVVACETTRKSIVIDPGADPDRIMGVVDANALDVTQIIHTHAHIDHIMGSFAVAAATGATARIHAHEHGVWAHLPAVAASFCIPVPATPPLGAPFHHDEVIHCGRVA